MSFLLSVEMIILAFLVITIVIYSVNKKKMCIQYSLVWVLLSLVLIVVAVFPDIVFWLSNILGIETPSNLVYLFGIFALLLITFMQTCVISKQAEKIKFLTQIVSIKQYELEDNNHDEKQ